MVSRRSILGEQHHRFHAAFKVARWRLGKVARCSCVFSNYSVQQLLMDRFVKQQMLLLRPSSWMALLLPHFPLPIFPPPPRKERRRLVICRVIDSNRAILTLLVPPSEGREGSSESLLGT